QFLIPLAVSIGYGVLFGTVIIVLTVPAVFMAQYYISSGLSAVIGAFSAELDPSGEQDTKADTPIVTELKAAE
ncbi:MAG: hypothetical protein QNK98_06095, partial [Yoonia sp.]